MKLVKYLSVAVVALSLIAGSAAVAGDCCPAAAKEKGCPAEKACCAEAKKAGKTCAKCPAKDVKKDAKK
jgi:hypothetical protein